MFLLVPAHRGSPGQRAINRLLLLQQIVMTVQWFFKTFQTWCSVVLILASLTAGEVTDLQGTVQINICPLCAE